MAKCARRNRLVVGDVLEKVRALEDNTHDACFPDAPYGQGMDEWDEAVPGDEVWKEIARVCKPGAPLLCFGAPKTHHRLMVAIEDAGWELKDCLIWLYTQGFPKSRHIGKAIRKKAMTSKRPVMKKHSKGDREGKLSDGVAVAELMTLADRWDGWGTALKPAWQPIVLAMKPLEGTYVENVAKWDCGGLWIDGARVPYVDEYDRKHQADICKGSGTFFGGNGVARAHTLTPGGRFPANVILDDVTAAALDAQYGATKIASISRCFFCQPVGKNGKSLDLPTGVDNNHKTLKPVELCKQLAKLLLPPERDTPRRILVPYAGTGSEMIGAMLAGWDFVHGIEVNKDYVEVASHRLRYWRGKQSD